MFLPGAHRGLCDARHSEKVFNRFAGTAQAARILRSDIAPANQIQAFEKTEA